MNKVPKNLYEANVLNNIRIYLTSLLLKNMYL
jgi:hypothetical protein